ncbi:MAG: ATP-binding protein [Deltaproteobacteria bacterium]|nr:ATP-binding protein [Deltaproteobacteria bacterium]
MIARTLENSLTEWFRKKPRKPLVLRGARQVGKSTLVRNWARQQNLKLAEINLERHPRLDLIFQSNDIPRILRELEVLANLSLALPNVVLFLDEIQATPHALPALRYFYEEKPDLPVVAAGSLLEFILEKHSFSMPVGRIDYLHVGPLTFSEFLSALGEDQLVKILQGFQLGEKIPEMAHARLLERQREFLFVGGMPESVAVYQNTLSPLEARAVHRSILQTYQDDFSKYNTSQKFHLLLQKILDIFPKIVGQKVKYSKLSSDDRSVDVKMAIEMLTRARLLLPCYHSDCSGLPLKVGRDEKVYKLYFLDVGLFNYLCGLEWSDISKLNLRELVHEGYLAEQFIAQHLAYGSKGLEAPELFYWLRESKLGNAELDFVISLASKILPIEVKAGKSGSLKSIQQFVRQKQVKNTLRFDLNLPTIQPVSHKLTGPFHGGEEISFTLISWPLYLVERVKAISL